MPGDPDPLYVLARATLLDALDALAEHLGAIVLVGAQADDEDLGNSSDPLTEMPRLTTSTRSRASAVLWATWDSSCRPGDHVPSRAAPLYLASNRSHSSLPSRPCA